jgi:hypothetical protein
MFGIVDQFTDPKEFNSRFDRLEYHLRNCSLCIIRRRVDLGEIGRGGVDWICLAQDKDKRRVLVNAVMNIRVP